MFETRIYEGEVFPVHCTKAYWATGSIALLTLKLRIRWRIVVSFTLLPL